MAKSMEQSGRGNWQQPDMIGVAGVGVLAKMLSNGSGKEMPKPDIAGPEKVDGTNWIMIYRFKKGVMKLGIKCQLTFLGSKLIRLQYTRV
ncbi:hypothetical protein MMC14_009643 [Varicellaria rhodocarpa]|nr:hypothetical protein [Varicellaria rhodocarpa]